MFKKIIFLFSLIFLCACTSNLKFIKVEKVDDFIKTTKNLVILDVRTYDEYSEGHITENAVNIDFYKNDFKEKVSKLPKDKTYLVYCRTSNRSKRAGKIMLDFGFKNVYILAGGFTEFSKTNFPLIVK